MKEEAGPGRLGLCLPFRFCLHCLIDSLVSGPYAAVILAPEKFWPTEDVPPTPDSQGVRNPTQQGRSCGIRVSLLVVTTELLPSTAPIWSCSCLLSFYNRSSAPAPRMSERLYSYIPQLGNRDSHIPGQLSHLWSCRISARTNLFWYSEPTCFWYSELQEMRVVIGQQRTFQKPGVPGAKVWHLALSLAWPGFGS